MKIKRLLLCLIVLFICGCQTISKTSIDDLINELATNINRVNVYRTGYSYYKTIGLSIKESSIYNEILESDSSTYYLYVDLISYYNKTNFDYKKSEKSYYSSSIEKGKKKGYLEINLQENNQYLIEIMFNYAKIEVMVDKEDITKALNYAIAILRSIEYNDDIINNLLDENVLSFQEETYNIFNTTSSDVSNYLKAVEQDQYVEDEQIKDTDLIN